MFSKLFFTPVYYPGRAIVQGWVVHHLNTFTGVWSQQKFTGSEITQQDIQYYQKGALIQDAFSRLSRTQREFLISGLSPQQQKALGMPED